MNTTITKYKDIIVIENHDTNLWSVTGPKIQITNQTLDQLKNLMWHLDTTIEEKLHGEDLSECCSAGIDSDTGRCMDCKEGCR